ncbi:MAG: Xaa-Pro dipeptidase [Gammaproteobacteria bacterium]|nr:Xaa-Pro dipeptidase [Gammaproteobacteria bacterium]
MPIEVDSLYPAHLTEVRRRTDRALAAHGFDGLVMFSGCAGYSFLDDRTYPFRANPHFAQWVPLGDAQQCFVGYVPGQAPLLCFHQPADYWHKPPELPTGDWLREFRLEVLRDPGSARELLGLAGRRIAFIGEWQAGFDAWGFAAVNPAALLDELHYHRAVKTPYEVECMRRASVLAARGHVAARDAFRAGASEFETHLAYCAAVGQRDEELPYGNIIAFNEGAAVLHYQHLRRERGVPRRSFLIDAGAQFRGYAADITRTYAADDGDFAGLVAGMDALQLELCAAIRSGTDYRDVHLLAHRLIAGLLRSAGIIDGDPDEAVATGLSSVFFPHGIGHLLGLQVHDVAGLARDASGGEIPRPAGHPYLRLTRVLEPGFVVTVEPGLYFIDLLLDEARGRDHGRRIRWDAVERLRPYGGIRIEDNVVCTAGAPENLTRDAFAN